MPESHRGVLTLVLAVRLHVVAEVEYIEVRLARIWPGAAAYHLRVVRVRLRCEVQHHGLYRRLVIPGVEYADVD